MTTSTARLVLEDGTILRGQALGASGTAIGELTALTAATGYQEALTSGVYAGSLLLFTSPHIGTTGVVAGDGAGPVRARGVILREEPRVVSNWRATGDLPEELARDGAVGITGVDTRALMRRLRGQTLRAGIFTGARGSGGELLEQVRAATPEGADALIAGVSTPDPYLLSGSGPVVAVVDLGTGGLLGTRLHARGASVHVLPAAAGAEQVRATGAERVLLSGGPGNPADATIALGLCRDLLEGDLPLLGIGLGHQILARALGHTTRRLHTPHHGANHPVQEVRTGKVAITSHSHSYTVEISDTDEVEITHVNLGDGTVEGFALRGRPVAGVQFHPDPGAGPSDAHALLESFLFQAKEV